MIDDRPREYWGKFNCSSIFGRGLAIASLNINSLLSHIDELRVFMHDSKIDILSINETKLDSTVHDSDVYIPGFEIVRKDRRVNGRKGGGVCIYLRANLNYRIRDDLINDDLECLIVEISKPRSSAFLVGTWYRPPNSPPERFNEFENVIDKIDAESKELYILGDVNCNLLPEASAHISSYLTNIFDIYGLSQLITEPTRVTPVSKTLIDLCITNSPEKVSNSGVIHLGISDHSSVFVTRKVHHDRFCPRTIEMRQFKHFQKNKVLSDLEQMPWSNVDLCSDPNDMWHEWKQIFVSCMDKHAPRELKRISKKRAPWITKGLLHKMHRRDLIKKKAISSNDHDTWEQFKCARNQANNAIKQAKKRYFSDNLKTSKWNPRKTWNLINELTSRNTSKSWNILEIQVDNTTISTPGDMAEAFNDHFTNIGQVLAQEVPAAEVNPEFYLSHTDKAFCLKTPSLDVVINLLRNIDEKKATGLDMIPSKLLKMAASIVAPSLTAIFTKSIITGVYPTEWKMARVTPVFKKGVKSNLNNYRPISVIPVVSKVFEKIVYDQLYQYLNDNQLLSSCQSGFRSLHSTLTALLEATNSWSVNIGNGFLNGVVFIDLKKAFDTIDQEIILRKLSFFGADQATAKWFQSYLSNRTQRCVAYRRVASWDPCFF